MAVPTLEAITPAAYLQITAREFAQAVLIPTSGSPTTLLFTALGGMPAIVALATAAATTTASGTAGTNTITVASATSITVGQLVVAAAIPSGTTVGAIIGSVLTLVNPTINGTAILTANMSSAAVNFLVSITVSGGIAVTANWPVPLVIGSDTYIVYISAGGGYPSYGGFAGSGSPSVVNVCAFT